MSSRTAKMFKKNGRQTLILWVFCETLLQKGLFFLDKWLLQPGHLWGLGKWNQCRCWGCWWSREWTPKSHNTHTHTRFESYSSLFHIYLIFWHLRIKRQSVNWLHFGIICRLYLGLWLILVFMLLLAWRYISASHDGSKQKPSNPPAKPKNTKAKLNNGS